MILLTLLLAATAPQVVEEFDKLARQPLWPGFEPAKIALAISDGGKTVFFRHPNPPPDFPVRANTSETISGVPTATLLLKPDRAAREQAAILIHETFHVFQRGRHPGWAANEAHLFTYPIENAQAQALVLLETEALSRAVERNPACWAARAREIRQRRFAIIGPEAAAYERLTELNEGLARFIESLSVGDRSAGIPTEGFPPASVRFRLYATGRAWALILDRLNPGWKDHIANSLDEMVALADVRACAFSPLEEQQASVKASRQAAELVASRKKSREEYLAQPGWTLILRFAKPAGLAGFDPMNVTRLEGGEVLHTRWIKLAAAGGEVEILNRTALTKSAGGHPLFNGVRELVVGGLPEDPSAAGAIRAPGVNVTVQPAAVAKDGKTVTVTLPQ